MWYMTATSSQHAGALLQCNGRIWGAAVLVPCCRSLHCVLHSLMLRLLSSHFPGSYLIRAQEGELRYLAAFNSPAAAAAWCITLHVSVLARRARLGGVVW
jgi:hypothetical protein